MFNCTNQTAGVPTTQTFALGSGKQMHLPSCPTSSLTFGSPDSTIPKYYPGPEPSHETIEKLKQIRVIAHKLKALGQLPDTAGKFRKLLLDKALLSDLLAESIEPVHISAQTLNLYMHHPIYHWHPNHVDLSPQKDTFQKSPTPEAPRKPATPGTSKQHSNKIQRAQAKELAKTQRPQDSGCSGSEDEDWFTNFVDSSDCIKPIGVPGEKFDKHLAKYGL